MTYTRTYNYDFNCDQNKNAESAVCFAIKSPRDKQSVSNVITNNSRPSRMGTENLYGGYFCIIPMRNVGEGQFLRFN